jgi:hypothetical protein
MAKQRGEFEACFAEGLDLSEFTSTNSAASSGTSKANKESTSVSHAATLLSIKQAELVMKVADEEEEAKMHDLLRTRVNQLRHVVANSSSHVNTTPRLPAPEQQTSILPSESRLRSNQQGIRSISNDKNLIHAAVVGMHGTEVHRNEHLPRKMLRSTNPYKRKNNNNEKSSKMNAKKVTKRKF